MKTKKIKKDKIKRKYTSYINTHQSFKLYEDETDNQIERIIHYAENGNIENLKSLRI